jgi:hypothetical protein
MHIGHVILPHKKWNNDIEQLFFLACNLKKELLIVVSFCAIGERVWHFKIIDKKGWCPLMR